MNLISKALNHLAQEELTATKADGTTPSEPKEGDTLIMDGPLGLALYKALNISHAKTDTTSVAVESQANDAILAAQMRLAQPEQSTPIDSDGTVLVYHGSVKDNTPESPCAKDVFEDLLKKSDMVDPAQFIFYSDNTTAASMQPPSGDQPNTMRFAEMLTKAKTNTGLGVESIQILVKLKTK